MPGPRTAPTRWPAPAINHDETTRDAGSAYAPSRSARISFGARLDLLGRASFPAADFLEERTQDRVRGQGLVQPPISLFRGPAGGLRQQFLLNLMFHLRAIEFFLFHGPPASARGYSYSSPPGKIALCANVLKQYAIHKDIQDVQDVHIVFLYLYP